MTSAYTDDHYDLGETRDGSALSLQIICETNAKILASGLAEIIPWCEIDLGEEVLLGHFTRDDPALRRFAVCLDGVCVGSISVREPWLKGPYLELLALFPKAQKSGIGRRLMEWFEAEAPSSTRSQWVLCSDYNLKALDFYESIGYQKITVIESLYDEKFSDYLLRKRIK